jgi:hypothetical protein
MKASELIEQLAYYVDRGYDDEVFDIDFKPINTVTTELDYEGLQMLEKIIVCHTESMQHNN